MNFRDTDCCAIQEISNLSGHPSALDAMDAFCKKNLDKTVKFKGWRSDENHIYSFYFFTAAVPTPGKQNSGYPRGEYGKNFAAFILTNKLGTIVESPIVQNKAYHSDHSNQVWIWTTDEAAIHAWWEKRKKELAPPPTENPVPPASPLEAEEHEDEDLDLGYDDPIEDEDVYDDYDPLDYEDDEPDDEDNYDE